MKILLLGANGMLGQSLYKILSQDTNMEVITVARASAKYSFDLTNISLLKECFHITKPDIVINVAAIVNLRQCEEHPEKAYNINGRIPGILAELCAEYNSYFIQVSTDHFYNNDGKYHHKESDKIFLPNEYSRSKYIGERLTLLNDNSIVIRTNIVGFRNNVLAPTFLEWAIKSLINEEKIILFDDFFTSSMFVDELSLIIKKIIFIRPKGIVNIASSSVSSKLEFVVLLSKTLFNKIPFYDVGHVNEVLDIKRGNSLGLDVKKIEHILNCKMPDLHEVINDINLEYRRSI